MKKFLVGIISLMLLASQAKAADRVQWPATIQPPSSWLNKMEKNHEIDIGTLLFDFIGRSNTGGFFVNLVIQPQTGMFVQAAPGTVNGVGSLYQVGVADTSVFGTGAGQFSADPTIIYHQAKILAPGNSVGPLVSPPGGDTVNDLIECQWNSADQTSQTVNFVSSSNVASSGPANRDRNDIVFCQAKLGTPALTGTQVTPTVDAGWLAVAVVVIPTATSTITGGMITNNTAFPGFAVAGAANAFVDLTTANQTITSVKVWNANQEMQQGVKLTSTSSVATGYAAVPGLSSDGLTHKGILVNVGDSSSLGVQFLTSGALNGLVISPTAFVAGTSSLSAANLTVANNVLTDSGTGVLLNYNTHQVLKTDGTNIYLTNPHAAGAMQFGDTAGNTTFGSVASTGYTIGSAVYGPSTATTGTFNSSTLTHGNCVQADGSGNLVSAAGPCGVTSGTITNVTGSGNVTAVVTSGTAAISFATTPTFTGLIVGNAGTTGTITVGTDANYTITRSAAAFAINVVSGAAPTLAVAGGYTAGNSTYGPSQAIVAGNIYGNYNSGSSSNYVMSYDGGTTNHAILAYAGLSFSNNATVYNSTSMTLVGTVNATAAILTGTLRINGQSASACVGTDASKNLVSSANCVTQVTAGTNIAVTGTGPVPIVSVTSAPSFSGAVAITSGGNVLAMSGSTTGNEYASFNNTGNSTLIGVESSAGNTVFTNANPYVTVIGTQSARDIQFATSNIVVGGFGSGGGFYVANGNVLPCYVLGGTTCTATAHMVIDSWTGSGADHTGTFVGSAAFANAVDWANCRITGNSASSAGVNDPGFNGDVGTMTTSYQTNSTSNGALYRCVFIGH